MTAGAIGQPSGEATARRTWSASSLALLLPFVAIVGVAAANGGFNATSFGWTALAFAWLVIIAVIIATPAWGAFDVVWLAVAGRSLSTHSPRQPGRARRAPRSTTGFARSSTSAGSPARCSSLRRGRTQPLAWRARARRCRGLRLLAGDAPVPRSLRRGHRGTGYRLFVPLGYWNALGSSRRSRSLLALGVATLGRGRVLRILAALALVPLTRRSISRSAGAHGSRWRSGCSRCSRSARCGFACSPARRLVPIPAAGVLLASRAPALTHQATALSEAAHAGHRLALELRGAGGGAGNRRGGLRRLGVADQGSTSARRAVGAWPSPPCSARGRRVRHLRSPPTLARHAYDSFVSPPTGGTDLNGRLFTLSNHGRTVLWRSALDDFRAHPVVGSGAGSFGRWWLAHRTTFYSVGEAHNLYVQTLAEGGVVGFALLVALLGVTAVAAVRTRRHPLVAPAFGAYVAFLVHAAVDWDWQMPAVTLLALFAGCGPVAATRGSEPRAAPGRCRSRGRAAAAAASSRSSPSSD